MAMKRTIPASGKRITAFINTDEISNFVLLNLKPTISAMETTDIMKKVKAKM